MQLNQKEIKSLLQKEDPIVLELGAHKGFDTKRFLKEFTNIKIYCFEPDPRCISAFKNLIGDPRCELIEAAVSNKDGKTILNISGGYFPGRWHRLYKLLKFLGLTKYLFKNQEQWDFSSSIKESISNPDQYPWLIFDKAIEIDIYKLDTWTKQNNIDFIDFIWSDIQGAERDMIEGATNTLKKVKYLYTEYGEVSTYPDALTREKTIELLSKHNFEVMDKYSSRNKIGNILFKNKYYKNNGVI